MRSPARRNFPPQREVRNLSHDWRFHASIFQLLAITNDRWAFANIPLQFRRLLQKGRIPTCDFLMTNKKFPLECKKLRQHLQDLFSPLPRRPQETWLLPRETVVHVFVEVYCEATQAHRRIAWLSNRLVREVLLCHTCMCKCQANLPRIKKKKSKHISYFIRCYQWPWPSIFPSSYPHPFRHLPRSVS